MFPTLSSGNRVLPVSLLPIWRSIWGDAHSSGESKDGSWWWNAGRWTNRSWVHSYLDTRMVEGYRGVCTIHLKYIKCLSRLRCVPDLELHLHRSSLFHPDSFSASRGVASLSCFCTALTRVTEIPISGRKDEIDRDITVQLINRTASARPRCCFAEASVRFPLISLP